MENISCPNKANKQVKREFDELKSIFGESKAYFLWNKNGGYGLEKASNGADSKLFSDLIQRCNGNREVAIRVKAQIYTEDFKKKVQKKYKKDGVHMGMLVDDNLELNADTVLANTEPSCLYKLHINGAFTNDFYRKEQGLAEQKAAEINDTVKLLNYKKEDRNFVKERDRIIADFRLEFPDFTIQPHYHDPRRYLDNDKRYYLYFEHKPIDIRGRRIDKSINRWKGVIENAIEKSESDQFLDSKEVRNILNELINQIKGRSKYTDELVSMIKTAVFRMMSSYGTKIQFKLDGTGLSEDNAARCIVQNGKYTIQINPSALFRNESGFKNEVAQSILHEMLHVVTELALRNDKELQKRAENLLSEIKKALGEDNKFYGTKDIFELFAELSNGEFLKALSEIKYENKSGKTITDKIKDFLNMVSKKAMQLLGLDKILKQDSEKIRSIGNKYNNSALQEAFDLLQWSMLPVDRKVVLSDTELRIYDIGTQSYDERVRQKLDAVNEKLYKRFDNLYKYYEKINKKSKRQYNTQNSVYDILGKLKIIKATQTQADLLSIQEALNFGLLTIGVIDNVTNKPTSDDCLLAYLMDQKDKDFKDVTPDELVDIYKSVICFYENMLKNDIPSSGQTQYNVEINQLLQVLGRSINDLKQLWKGALYKTVNDIITETVENGVIADNQTKQNMIKVLQDYFGKHSFYGDINTVTNWCQSLSRSQSPIIKMAYDMIHQQETATAEEFFHIENVLNNVYKRVKKLDRLDPNWQKIMMEFDRDGIPTGNFVRDINYGQYKLDYEKFIENLNKQWVEQRGYSYEINPDTGEYVRSDTKASSDDEEWENGQMPDISEYRLRIYKWKTHRANMRYTYEYYKERLSQPYDPNDPNCELDEYLETHHGLSPRTLSRYNHIQSKINYYTNQLYKNGKFSIESFTEEDERKLDSLYDELNQLSNIYNVDGTKKQDEGLQMAYELKAWQKWFGNKTNLQVDEHQYNIDKMDIGNELNEAQQKGDQDEINKIQRKLELFVKYNSSYQIDPELTLRDNKQFDSIVFNGNPGLSNDDLMNYGILREKLMRGMIKSIVKQRGNIEPNLDNIKNNLFFFKKCKEIDQAIADYYHELKKKKAEANKQNIQLKKQQNGVYTMLDENLVSNPNDPNNDETSYLDYIIDYYFNIIKQGWSDEISGYFTNFNTGQVVDFSSYTDDEIKQYLHQFFTYTSYLTNPDTGEEYTVDKPLSVFTYNTGNTLTQANIGDPYRLVMSNYPSGRYATKYNRLGSDYINENYDKDQSNISEQPKIDWYDNFNQYYGMRDKCGMLYDALIKAMEDVQQQMGIFKNGFDFKLPKMETSDVIIASRALRQSNVSFLKTLAEQYFNVTTNDANERSTEDKYIGPDGEENQNVPLKYIGTLKDRWKYTYNIQEAVLMYIAAGIDYKNKNKILSKLQTLWYAQQKKNKEDIVTDAATERDLYKNMMNNEIYKNTQQNTPQQRAASVAKKIGIFQMLAFNFLSMNAGLYDSFRSIIRDSLCGRYFTVMDFLPSVIYNLTRLPMYIANFGNKIANTKLIAFNKMLGITQNIIEQAKGTSDNKILKLVNKTFLGAYGAIDFLTSNIILHAILHNCKFYDGGIVPTGFYRLYDLKVAFTNAGYNGTRAVYEWSKLGTSLWGAYKFNIKTGNLTLKDQYKPYVNNKLKSIIKGMAKERISNDNGTTPENGKPRYTQTILGSFAGTMRGFMVNNIMEGFAGRDDVSVREFDENGKIKPRTAEQKQRRMSWNYATGLPEPETAKALFRSIQMLMSNIYNIIRRNSNNVRKLSKVEAFAIKTAFIQIAMLLALIGGYKYVDDWCKDVDYGRRQREEPDFKNFFKRKLYKEWIRNGYIRTTNSALEQMDPTSMMDVVNSLTTLKTAVDNIQQVPMWLLTGDKTALDVFSVDMNQRINTGKFKGFKKGETIWRRSIGPLNNIQSALTYNGLSANTQFYTRNYSWWMGITGRPYKPFKVPRAVSIDDEYDKMYNFDDPLDKMDKMYDKMYDF